MTELDTARLDMLRDLDPGSTAYLDRAIRNFQANSSAAVDAIRRHVVAGEAAAMRAVAHRISGSALNLGASFAAAVARRIESLGDAGTTDGALDLLPDLEAAMARARELLLTYQATYAAAK